MQLVLQPGRERTQNRDERSDPRILETRRHRRKSHRDEREHPPYGSGKDHEGTPRESEKDQTATPEVLQESNDRDRSCHDERPVRHRAVPTRSETTGQLKSTMAAAIFNRKVKGSKLSNTIGLSLLCKGHCVNPDTYLGKEAQMKGIAGSGGVAPPWS